MLHRLLPLAACVVFATAAAAQTRLHPLVPDYGWVVDVPEAALAPAADRAHRIAFDLATADTLDGVNRGLWYLARLRNLLALAGVPADSVAIAGVLHGGATALASAKTVRPADRALMRALRAAGVTFYVCGQSAASAGIAVPGDLHGDVTPALSAMTTFVELDRRGYAAW